MKTTNLFYVALLTVGSIGCSKSDGDGPPEEMNNPPAAFDLIGVADGAAGVEISPTLTWEAAADPEGSAVTYDLILDTQTTPTEVHASDLTGTFFQVTDALCLSAEYFWKVVARDDTGNTTQSTTQRFRIRDLNLPIGPVTAAANFPARGSHASAIFDNKMWVIAGSASNQLNDVWYSSDGASWLQATSSADFTPRNGTTSAVFDNKLWVIGGNDPSTWQSDVWSSSDGVTWTEATPAASFSGRVGHTTTTFDNKLWLVGGWDGNAKNDIWYSTDGVDWEEVSTASPFSALSSHTSVVFDHRIWLIAVSGDEVWAMD